MSTHHTVTLPDGTTAKRTSANRQYSHVVCWGPEARADVVARYREDLARTEASYAHSRKVIDYVRGGGELVLDPDTGSLFRSVHAPGLPGIDPYRGVGWYSNGKFIGTAGDTLAEQVIAWFESQVEGDRPARLRALIAETETGSEWVGGWEALTWASRPDLAEKAAVRYRGRGREVSILETERHTK